MVYLVSAQEMREMDRMAMEELGIPPAVLMENAGAALAREILSRYPDRRRVAVVCGAGNNGGDGFVAARWLANQGCDVTVCFLGRQDRLSPESALHYRILRQMGERVRWLECSQETGHWEAVRRQLAQTDLVVDALFGVGLSRPVTGHLAQVIGWVNESQAVVVAADIPSGVNADTGAVEGAAVEADVTVTFGCPKRGHYLFPGAQLRGELVVADISIPSWLAEPAGVKGRLLTAEQVAAWLPVRRVHSHKGTYGHVLVIGGSREMVGAPVFAASAALAGGAGYVTMAVPEPVLAQAAVLEPTAVFWPWPAEAGRFSSRHWPSSLAEEVKARRVTAAVLGPGIGRLPEPRQWLESLLALPVPLVVDADGLNMLSGHLDLLTVRRDVPTVLTPHPGEMARLCQTTVADLEGRRWDVAARFAGEHGVAVVLKGTHTLMAFPDGSVWVNPTGAPALAKAGSGDVLAGLMAAFLAQGLPLEEAVGAAVFVHALAGRHAAVPSPHSSKPSILIAAIGTVLAELQGNQGP
ncbi:MAG: hypothetical protein A6D91_07680 [Bacillaceae bacterium G1]|nr:MAG: hypothetical protein A6D91_07680 [Bacillaceae bacterium G1]